MAMLYTQSIANPPQNMMVVFKMSDSVPSARYSPFCNVLRQWKTSLTPIYRVYRLYDIPENRSMQHTISPQYIIFLQELSNPGTQNFTNDCVRNVFMYIIDSFC